MGRWVKNFVMLDSSVMKKTPADSMAKAKNLDLRAA